MFVGQKCLIVRDNIVGTIVGYEGKSDFLVRFTYDGITQVGLFRAIELRSA